MAGTAYSECGLRRKNLCPHKSHRQHDWITYDELLRKLCERMGLANVSFTGENNETKEYLGVSSVRDGIPDDMKLTINQLFDSMDYNIEGY